MATAREDAHFQSPIPPARVKRKFYDVLRAHVGKPERGFCLHQEIIPVMTHWHPFANGKVRHWDTGCHWCEFFPPEEVRFYGYMPAWHDVKGKVVALEITWQAALDCPQLNGKRIPLRGLEMIISRYGKSDHNRAGCQVQESHLTRQLPPPIEVSEFLDAIFYKCEQVPAIAGARKFREEAHP